MYLDALFGQFPSQNGLQCRVSDAQLTSPSFTLLINRRDSHRFLSNLTLVLCSRVNQICIQRQQVLQVTLAGMCPKYGEIYLLIVGTICQTLTVIKIHLSLIKIHLSVCVMRSILDWIAGLRRKDIRLCKGYIYQISHINTISSINS